MTTCRYQYCPDCGADIKHEEGGFRTPSPAIAKAVCEKCKRPVATVDYLPGEPLLCGDCQRPKRVRKESKKPNRPDWLVRYTNGLEHGEDWDCLYEGKTWALVRVPGYTHWSGIGYRVYGRTEFRVQRKDLGGTQGSGGLGHSWDAKEGLLKGNCLSDMVRQQGRAIEVFEVHEGRMNKALLKDLIDQVKLLDKEKP